MGNPVVFFVLGFCAGGAFYGAVTTRDWFDRAAFVVAGASAAMLAALVAVQP